MENIFEKLVDIFIAIIIFFLLPLQYFSIRQDSLTQQIVDIKTASFMDTVRTQGFMTKSMYNKYLESIDNSHIIWDVELSAKHICLEPEYRFKTPDEVIDDQNREWNGSNIYTYRPVYTDKPIVTDSVNNDGLTLNNETNESILSKAVNTPADPNHIHTDECYGLRYEIDSANACTGTLHWTTGMGMPLYDMNNGYNTYFTPFLNAYVYECSKCDLAVIHLYLSDYAEIYSFPYQWTIELNKSDWNYTSSGVISIISQIVNEIKLQNMVGKTHNINGPPYYALTEAANYFESKMIEKGYRVIPVSKSPYKDHARVSTYDNSYHSQIDFTRNNVMLDRKVVYGVQTLYTLPHYKLRVGTPLCNEIIKSIVPTHQDQVIYKGEPIITCATATFLDGSTKVILCNSSFNVNNIGSNQTAILSYLGKDSATTTKNFTCTVKVNVLPKSKTCINGHTYNLKNDGTDPGCPYCDAWLANLIVYQPTAGNLTMYKGTSLSDNGVILLATYLNGRIEYVENGYVDNLDKNYIGQQTVTISYKGKYTSLNVLTKRKLKKCDICGRYYELFPDDTDPGCPYCAALIPVFTGNVLKYFTIIEKNEILTEVYEESGIYYFDQGDYITIKVMNKSDTLATKFINISMPSIPKTSIHVEQEGIIRDVKMKEVGG
ncbi:MAG: hypothetical protein K0S41_4063 [Anaerocolumna sp.]|nr:hypothetical protein [Anaerocolumna sp.]